jgi:hypothetical protein
MKACEPRDLLDRVLDICLFEGQPIELTPKVIDSAWRNYFGTSHGFAQETTDAQRRGVTGDARSVGDLVKVDA